MLRKPRFPGRVIVAAFSVAVLATGVLPAVARVESASPYKRFQANLLMREPMHEKKERKERDKELRELARELKRHGQSSLVKRGNKWRAESPDEDVRLGKRPAPLAPRQAAIPAAGGTPPDPNVRINNTTGDFSGEGQCETSIAAWGQYMVAAWNDSKGFRDGTGQTQGWATSTDGGDTWTDQGTLPGPSSPVGWKWTSDPVVIVNPNTGAFYYSGLADANGGLNAIGVIKGRFSGGTFNWTNRSSARSADYSQYYLDKEWIALDPASGRVYLTYTNFTSGLDRIETQSADSSLSSWSAPLKISADIEDGYVQGSRPVVGSGGTVLVCYYGIGLVDADYIRFCRSTNAGGSYSAPTNAIAFFSNYGTGAPGFNRDNPIPNFPSIAVDRSTGPHAGRVYLTWAECLNWYDDAPNSGNSGVKPEVEPNETFGTATIATPGNRLNGILSTASDFDFFRVSLTAGQTIMVFADSSASGLTMSLRMFAADGTTRLAWTTASSGDIAAGFQPGWIWTAPANGNYYVRVASQFGSGSYRLRTGIATRTSERGTDQRDVFVAWSDNNGASWSTPVRVDDAPIGLDGWLPEVAVGTDGQVYTGWYDWRDAPAATSGGESQIYLARSSDGGSTWAPLGAASDTLSNWTACESYIQPNQGDYMSLHASATTLSVCWSDARGGTPDTYASFRPIGPSSASVTLVSADAVPGRVDLDWLVSPPAGFVAALHRSIAGTDSWTMLDSLHSTPSGHLIYADTTVALGTTYTYRLGVMENGTEYFRGAVTVLVPSGLGLAFRGVYPNPTNGAGASISFTLPYAEPVTVDVYDLTGRIVHSQTLTGLSASSHVIPFTLWPSARSGVYLVRITQRGETRTSRAVVVR